MNHLILAVALSAQSSPPPTVSAGSVLPDTKASYRANSSPTCSDWISARRGKDEHNEIHAGVYRKWVLGYISGFNVVGPDQTGNLLATSSGNEFYAALDGYCTRNPSYLVADAMRPIIVAIIGRRGIPAMTPSSTDARKQATIVSPDACQEWVRDSDNSILRLAHVVMIGGYITAYNQWGPDAHGDAVGAEDNALIEKTIDKWCSANPSGLLIGIVMPLIEDVAAQRAAGRLPPAGMRPTDKYSK